MTSKEKILELLAKDSLTQSDAELINNAFDKSPELKIYQSIMNLLSDLSNTSHLASDLIAEYVLYKNNMLSENDSIIKIIPKIEKHLSGCKKCMSEYGLLNSEYSEIDNYINEKIVFDQKQKTKAFETLSWSGIYNQNFSKYSFASVLALVLLYVSIFTVSEITTPSYKDFSSVYELENYSSNRGRVSNQFQKGLDAIKMNDYYTAAKMFEEDIDKNANDETLFYTRYTLGLVYLQKSEHDFLGLFTSFDKADLDNAILNFEEAIRTNSSGLFDNITYDSYYFLGRTYLLIDDYRNGTTYLNLVIENKGRFYQDAKELIVSLEKGKK